MPAAIDVISQFKKRIKETVVLYDELLLAVHEKKRQASLETMLAEQCVMAMVVLWEAFVHDLMIAYIGEKSETCVQFQIRRVRQSIETKNKAVAKWVKIRPPRSLSRAQLEFLVDPGGFNLTAGSAEELANRANQLLTASHAKKFSLGVDDRQFIDVMIAVRNYLSHRSAGSLLRVKRQLSDYVAAVPTSPLGGQLTTVGAFLKGRVGTGDTRAKSIGATLCALADKLA